MSFPYATDYTAIVHHRSRQATMNDINLSGLPGGGLDLWAAAYGAVAMAVVGVPTAVLWMAFVPLPTALFLLPLLPIWVVVYWIAQRDTEGRQTILQRLKVMAVRMMRQPTQVAGMATDTEPTHFQWVAIVARHSHSDAPALPVRQYVHYGYDSDLPQVPVQGRLFPAADEPLKEWQYRVWWETGGQFVEDDLADNSAGTTSGTGQEQYA